MSAFVLVILLAAPFAVLAGVIMLLVLVIGRGTKSKG